MIAMLGHRGPDGYGLFRDDRVGLGHARLSIIDLEGGFQPLTNEDARSGSPTTERSSTTSSSGASSRRAAIASAPPATPRSSSTSTRSTARARGPGSTGSSPSRCGTASSVGCGWCGIAFGILPMFYAAAGRVAWCSRRRRRRCSRAASWRPEIDPAAVVEAFTRWSVAAPRSSFVGVRSVRAGERGAVRPRPRALASPATGSLDFTEDPALGDDRRRRSGGRARSSCSVRRSGSGCRRTSPWART